MTENQAFYARDDLVLALQIEYTRSFICSNCGYEEHAIPSIPIVEGDFIPLIYGSGVDFCTHCSKVREEFEETTDSPADYDESAEGDNDHNLQAEAKDPETM
jgi:hypothetical protein